MSSPVISGRVQITPDRRVSSCSEYFPIEQTEQRRGSTFPGSRAWSRASGRGPRGGTNHACAAHCQKKDGPVINLDEETLSCFFVLGGSEIAAPRMDWCRAFSAGFNEAIARLRSTQGSCHLRVFCRGHFWPHGLPDWTKRVGPPVQAATKDKRN